MATLKLPTHIRRKSEALDLAAQLFPKPPPLSYRDTAQARGPQLFDQLYATEKQLREFLEWLYDDHGKMRIYQRPRWHFFYAVAHQLIGHVKEIQSQLNTLYDREFRDRQRDRLHSPADPLPLAAACQASPGISNTPRTLAMANSDDPFAPAAPATASL